MWLGFKLCVLIFNPNIVGAEKNWVWSLELENVESVNLKRIYVKTVSWTGFWMTRVALPPCQISYIYFFYYLMRMRIDLLLLHFFYVKAYTYTHRFTYIFSRTYTFFAYVVYIFFNSKLPSLRWFMWPKNDLISHTQNSLESQVGKDARESRMIRYVKFPRKMRLSWDDFWQQQIITYLGNLNLDSYSMTLKRMLKIQHFPRKCMTKKMTNCFE